MNAKPRYGYIAENDGKPSILIMHPSDKYIGYYYAKGYGWNIPHKVDLWDNQGVDEYITEQEAYDMIKKYIENGNDPVDFYKEVKFNMN